MASIPLPALNVRTPEQPDLLQKYGQLQQLKMMQQQSQLQQQEAPLRIQALQTQAQDSQLGLQQKQRELDSQNAIMDAYTKSNGHLSQAYDLAAKSGKALPGDLEKLKQADIQMQTQALGLVKAKGERAIQEADLFSGAADAVKKAPPEQRAAVYQQQIANLAQAGLDVSQVPPQYPGDQQFAALSLGLQSHKNALDQAYKAAQTQNELAKPQEAATRAAETARHNLIEEKQGQQRIGAEYARLKFDRDKQGTQDDASIETQAQQIAKYELPLPPQSRMNPRNSAVMKRALEINPQLSSEGYVTNQDFLKSTGKANAQVQSLNKLSAHLGELQSASDKAGFSPVGFTAAGKDLRLAEQLFSKEDVKFLSGSGVGTEGELNGLIEKTHSPIQSVRDSAINTLSRFTADAARQLGDQYERGTKQKFDPNQHFTPTTVQMMQKSGGTSARESKITVTAPDGSTHPFDTQAQADAFKKLAGIK